MAVKSVRDPAVLGIPITEGFSVVLGSGLQGIYIQPAGNDRVEYSNKANSRLEGQPWALPLRLNLRGPTMIPRFEQANEYGDGPSRHVVLSGDRHRLRAGWRAPNWRKCI